MTWNVLQSKSIFAASGSSLAAPAYGSALGSGNKLIALVSVANTTTTAVKDAALNSFTKIASKTSAANSCDLSLWAIDTPAGDVGGTPVITATFAGASNGCAILVQEVSGLLAGNTTAMVDGTAGTETAAVGANTTSPVYSSTAAGEYLVACYGDDGLTQAITWTKPAGYTADPNAVNSQGDSNVAISYANSTNGAESGNYTQNVTSDDKNQILVAFQLAAATAAVPSSPARSYAPGWHPGQGLPGLPGGIPFWSPPAWSAPAAAAAAPPAQAVFPPAPARAAPRRARLGATGLAAAGILATGIGPPAVRALHQPPAIAHPAPHRAQWRSGQGSPPGAAQQVKVPVPVTVHRRTPHAAAWRGGRGTAPAALPQPFRPVTVFTRGVHRALWRGGAGPAVAAVQGTGTPQPTRPVTVFRRVPHPAAWHASRGVPPAAAAQPTRPPTVFARPQHRAQWRGGAGPAVTFTPGTGTPQPFRPATVYRRSLHGALWRTVTGRPPAATAQPTRPVTVFRRILHRAAWQHAQGAPPAAQKQPTRPATVYTRPRHRVRWRGGAGSPPGPPPAFTVGTLTAADKPGSALTGAAAGNAVAGSTAATGTITARDQRTGGPS